MQLEPRDYLSGLAIMLSLGSLFVSLRSAAFSKRTKAAELRAQVLLKYAEAKNQAILVREHYASIRRAALEADDLKLFQIGNHDSDLARISTKLENIYGRIERIPIDRSVQVYEQLFPDVHDICMQLDAFKATAEREVTAHSSRKRGLKSPEENAQPCN